MFPQDSPSSSLSIAVSVSAIALLFAFLAILEVAHSSQNDQRYLSINGQKIPHNPTSVKCLYFIIIFPTFNVGFYINDQLTLLCSYRDKIPSRSCIFKNNIRNYC